MIDTVIEGARRARRSGRGASAAGKRADEFPNHFVGDLVETDRGWVVVPPTCCPAGHDFKEGWSVSRVWCSCSSVGHMGWRCWCGKSIYAPQPGPDCRIRDRGPVSMFEQDQRRQAGESSTPS